MSKTCARAYCDEPNAQPHRRGAGLCVKHAAERKARQAYTATIPNCAYTGCGDKSSQGSDYCRRHQALFDTRRELPHLSLEQRVERLERLVEQLLEK